MIGWYTKDSKGFIDLWFKLGEKESLWKPVYNPKGGNWSAAMETRIPVTKENLPSTVAKKLTEETLVEVEIYFRVIE